jgi:hypothetical protein
MPRAASVVLSTVLRFSGLIFAPDASRSSSIFFWIPVTSNPFTAMTLSRLFTKALLLARRQGNELRRTIEPPNDRLPVITLFYNDFYVWVLSGEGLEVVSDVCARVGG